MMDYPPAVGAWSTVTRSMPSAWGVVTRAFDHGVRPSDSLQRAPTRSGGSPAHTAHFSEHRQFAFTTNARGLNGRDDDDYWIRRLGSCRGAYWRCCLATSKADNRPASRRPIEMASALEVAWLAPVVWWRAGLLFRRR